ncbi:MAG: sulfatase-like hydrolase/transferase [Bacteroidota bacterium]|nr:sulfatase-like hydrolase/transferase [Bacteroidota bacterium]
MNHHRLAYMALTASIFCAPKAVCQNAKEQLKTKQPNIIFILTDDLGYGDLGVFFQKQREKANNRNEPFIFTPNLDRMATKGAIMSQHYCAAPVSAPSRASILLGVSQGHANVRDNQFDKALEDNYTIGNVLQKAGYTTAAIGKWGLQGLGKDTNWPAHPLNRGFDYYYGYMRHGDGHEHYPKEGLYDGAKQVWENRKEVSKDLDKCYTGDLWTAVAKKWIEDYEKGKDAKKPFFMYLAYDTPHAVLELPTQAYPEGGGLKGGVQWLGTPGHMINTASGTIDSWVHPDYANATWDDDNNPATPEVAWPDTYKRQATIVRRIDSEVGDLIQLFKDLKIDSNTLIIFTSDNGPSNESYLPKNYVPNNPDFFNSFGPFDGIKRDCWEGGLRVPTIALWPHHIPANLIVTSPSISYDWLPTFAEVAGFAAPARTDGVSLLPSLTGKGEQRNSSVYVEYYQEGVTPNYKDFDPSHRLRRRNQMQMVRFGDKVGVRYNVKSAEDNFEIYDVASDPKEVKNLAGDVIFSALQQQMKDKVLQVRRPDNEAPRTFDDALVPAVTNNKVVKGIVWKAFKGHFPWLPEVRSLSPIVVGVTNLPVIDKSNKNKGDVYAFEGYIKVPVDGSYTFYMTSGTKAFMRIHEAAIIDADYNYEVGTEKAGKIKLKAGLHPFRIYYSNPERLKTALLKLQWEGPSIAKTDISADILYHDK